jgi:hypothetical protein
MKLTFGANPFLEGDVAGRIHDGIAVFELGEVFDHLSFERCGINSTRNHQRLASPGYFLHFRHYTTTPLNLLALPDRLQCALLKCPSEGNAKRVDSIAAHPSFYVIQLFDHNNPDAALTITSHRIDAGVTHFVRLIYGFLGCLFILGMDNLIVAH